MKADEFLYEKYPFIDDMGYSLTLCKNIEDVMIEFAKLHVQKAVEKICEDVYHNVEIDWIDYHDFSAGHNGIKGDIDYDSIKEAYPLSNII